MNYFLEFAQLYSASVLVHENPIRRHKRSSSASSPGFTCSLAAGTAVSGRSELGDTHDFTLRVELPEMAAASALSVVVSGSHPVNNTAGVHLNFPTVRTIVGSYLLLMDSVHRLHVFRKTLHPTPR